jgi:hypothetical protein
MTWVPQISDELPRLVHDDVLRYEEARVKALDVFEHLRWVVGDGRLCDGGVRGEEARYRSIENVAVEIVGGQLPLDQEDRGDRVAA